MHDFSSVSSSSSPSTYTNPSVGLARGLFNEALRYYNNGDYDAAIRVFTKALTYGIEQGPIYDSRGNAYKRKKEYDRAIADFNAALSSSEGGNFSHAGAHANRGGAYLEMGEWAKAIADYNEALKSPGKLGSALGSIYDCRGYCHSKLGNTNQAILDFKKSIDLGYQTAIDDLCDEYFNKAFNSYNNKDYNEAISGWSKVIEYFEAGKVAFSESISTAYYNLGAAYRDLGDQEKALAFYKKGADYGDEDSISYLAKIGVPYTPKKPQMPTFTGAGGSGGSTSSQSSSKSASGSYRSSSKPGVMGYILPIGAFIIGGSIAGSILNGILGGLVARILGILLPRVAAKTLAETLIVLAAGIACFIILNRKHISKFILYALIALFCIKPVISIASSVTGIEKTAAKPAASKTPAGTATVTADSLNLRWQPSASADLVRTLKKGDALTVTGEAKDGWLPVEYKTGDGNAVGFVSAQYVKIE